MKFSFRLLAFALFFIAASCAISDLFHWLGGSPRIYSHLLDGFTASENLKHLVGQLPIGIVFIFLATLALASMERLFRAFDRRAAARYADFTAPIEPVELDAEDKEKINSEVNQILNQRFLLSTAALTLFAGYSALTVQGAKTAPPDFVLLLSSVNLLLLGILFTQSYFLRRLQRTYAVYMRLIGASRWEKDFNEFRRLGYFAYTKVEALLYIILTVLSSAFPAMLTIGKHIKPSIADAPVYVVSFGFTLASIMIFIAFFDWFGSDTMAEAKWRRVLKGSKKEEPAHQGSNI